MDRRCAVRRLERSDSFIASVNYFSDFCDNFPDRDKVAFNGSATEVFQAVYDVFFEQDYGGVNSFSVPDLRMLHHMNYIGMGAIQDKYGVVAVCTNDAKCRAIAKDLSKNEIVADVTLEKGVLENIGAAYVVWGRQKLAEMT